QLRTARPHLASRRAHRPNHHQPHPPPPPLPLPPPPPTPPPTAPPPTPPPPAPPPPPATHPPPPPPPPGSRPPPQTPTHPPPPAPRALTIQRRHLPPWTDSAETTPPRLHAYQVKTLEPAPPRAPLSDLLQSLRLTPTPHRATLILGHALAPKPALDL